MTSSPSGRRSCLYLLLVVLLLVCVGGGVALLIVWNDSFSCRWTGPSSGLVYLGAGFDDCSICEEWDPDRAGCFSVSSTQCAAVINIPGSQGCFLAVQGESLSKFVQRSEHTDRTALGLGIAGIVLAALWASLLVALGACKVCYRCSHNPDDDMTDSLLVNHPNALGAEITMPGALEFES